MKLSTKWIAVVAVAAAFFSINVNAQMAEKNKWHLGFGLEGGVPTGIFKVYPAYSNFELGGTVRLQYDASNAIALTLTSGYYNFFPTEEARSTFGENYGVIPIKAGIKGFLVEGLYVAGEIGAGFETVYGKNAKLILSPAIGWASRSWDIGVRYESLSGNDFVDENDTYGVVALRLAYSFKL